MGINKCILLRKTYRGFEKIKKQAATKKYFACCNDFTKCPKTGCETGKINPFTTMYDLVISKKQKSQKLV